MSKKKKVSSEWQAHRTKNRGNMQMNGIKLFLSWVVLFILIFFQRKNVFSSITIWKNFIKVHHMTESTYEITENL